MITNSGDLGKIPGSALDDCTVLQIYCACNNTVTTNFLAGRVLTESDLPELQRLLTDIADQSFNIGLQLGVPLATVKALQRRSQSDTIQFLRLILSKWLGQKNPPPTLKELTKVLSGPLINNKRVADKVREHLGSLTY